MKSAMEDVQSNRLNIKQAAFKYSLNRTTLMNHLKNSRDGSVGRPTILTRAEEIIIVHAIQKLADWGFGIDRDVVRVIVQDYITRIGRRNKFTGGKPGLDWMYGFEQRWRAELTRPVGQPLPANRAYATYACN